MGVTRNFKGIRQGTAHERDRSVASSPPGHRIHLMYQLGLHIENYSLLLCKTTVVRIKLSDTQWTSSREFVPWLQPASGYGHERFFLQKNVTSLWNTLIETMLAFITTFSNMFSGGPGHT